MNNPGQSARAGQGGQRRQLLQGLGGKISSSAVESHEQVWTRDVSTPVCCLERVSLTMGKVVVDMQVAE